MTRSAAIVASLALLLAGATLADTPRVLPLLRDGILTGGAAGMHATRDLDGDGVRDLVTCGAGNAFALAKRGSGYATIWYSEQIGCNAIEVGDRNDDGAAEIFVAASGTGSVANTIFVFDPRSLAAALGSVTLPVAHTINDIAVGDPDHDGHLEILAVTQGATYMYDAKTLALEWTATDKGGTHVAIGNIDDDGRIEVVVNSTTGHILDAYARNEKWGWVGGFGDMMAVGNVDADPELEIVYIDKWAYTLYILEGDAGTTSTISLARNVDAIALGDTTGDGIAEILTGNNQWDDIAGYRRSDGVKLWSVDSPDWGCVGLTSGDVDGDGVIEVIWGSYDGGLFVASTASKLIEFAPVNLDPSYFTVISDLDGDGRLEQVVAVGSTDNGYDGGRVEILDFATRASKAVLAKVPNAYEFPEVWDLAVGQLDADPAKEILVNHGTLFAWDGATYQHQWTSPGGGFQFAPMVVMNIDADPVDEIIIAMSDEKVVALNGASPIIQWSSPTLDGSWIEDIGIADVNGNGLLDIAVGTSAALYVFEYPTGTQRLKSPLTNIRRVAATAMNGGEVAVGYDSGNSGRVRTYAGTTLTKSWECTTTDLITVLRYGVVGGRSRLAAGTSAGNLRLFAPGGTSCPAAETKNLGRGEIVNLGFLDTTGDGRSELLFTQWYVWGLYSLGWQDGEPRGDMNADGQVTDADIDALIAYLLGGAPGAPPSGDVNADGRIALDDVFTLIDYRRGTGPMPPP